MLPIRALGSCSLTYPCVCSISTFRSVSNQSNKSCCGQVVRHPQRQQLAAVHSWDYTIPKRQCGAANFPKDIAIIGGGITGLTAAYEIVSQASGNSSGNGGGDDSVGESNDAATSSRGRPRSRTAPGRRAGLGADTVPKVTIYESSSRLGGWLNSTYVNVPTGGQVMFESGPRTLRPKGASARYTLDLLDRLGLADEMLMCPKDAPAAKNRFIYYPDRLVKLPDPTSIQEMLEFARSELSNGLASGLANDFWDTKSLAGRTDISIGHFLSKWMDPAIADLASAGFHGIYAGDIDRISMGAIMPRMFKFVEDHGSLTRGYLKESWRLATQRKQLLDVPDVYIRPEIDSARLSAIKKLANCSVFSFREGLAQLSNRLVEKLQDHPNITIKLNTKVTGIHINPSLQGNPAPVAVETSEKSQGRHRYSQVLATTSSTTLAPLLSAPSNYSSEIDELKAHLTFNPAVTVMVVNLYFQSPDLLPVEGFGYLIPRHIPWEQNPECALGVVFDSDAIQGQDTTPTAGTKLTVMLGGHYWDSYQESDYPTEAKGIEMAQAILRRHLKITEQPVVARANLNRNCIPQYQVDHPRRIAEIHQYLSDEFKGQLMVGGSSYNGVSVNDCIKAGTNLATLVINDIEDSGLLAPDAIWRPSEVPIAS